MKWFAAVGFLAATFGSIWLDLLSMKRAVLRLQNAKRSTVVSFLVGSASLLLKFVAFASLTGLFPTYLVLTLIGASLVAAMLYSLAGAVGGFGLPDVREKIGALSVIWGTQNKIGGCAIMSVGLLLIVGQVAGSLWAYATHPRGDAEAVGWIALFLFILPRLVAWPVQMGVNWPVVTSPFIDNDVRNEHLATQFVLMLNTTIILAYPFILFREQMTAVLGTVPPLWILLSTPVFFFLLLGAIPFFVGTQRFRFQSRAQLAWRREWLKELLPILHLPVGERRSEALDNKLTALREEIARRFRENTLLSLYQEHFAEEVAFGGDQAAGELASAHTALPAAEPDVDVALAVQAIPSSDSDTERIRHVRQALQYLRGRQYIGLGRGSEPSRDLFEAMRQVLVTSRHRLVDWDISFHEIRQLLDLYSTSLDARTKNLTAFVKSHLEILDSQALRLKGTSRWTLGSIVTVVSGVVVAVLRAYQDDIMKGLFSLMGV